MVYNQKVFIKRNSNPFATFSDFFFQTNNECLMKNWAFGKLPENYIAFTFVKKVDKVSCGQLGSFPITILRQKSNIYLFDSRDVYIQELGSEFQNIWK